MRNECRRQDAAPKSLGSNRLDDLMTAIRAPGRVYAYFYSLFSHPLSFYTENRQICLYYTTDVSICQ